MRAAQQTRFFLLNWGSCDAAHRRSRSVSPSRRECRTSLSSESTPVVFSCWHQVQNCGGQPAVYQQHSYKTVLTSISKDVDSSINYRKYRMRLLIRQKLSFWTRICALYVLGEFISSAGFTRHAPRKSVLGGRYLPRFQKTLTVVSNLTSVRWV